MSVQILHFTKNGEMLMFLCLILQEFQKKTSISALLTVPKPLTVWITIN